MIKGVNLGNWLVLEKWMSPVVFEGLEEVEDETWLARTLSPELLMERMKAHRETYITERDFAYIARHGFNTIRIPVPYFIFGDRKHFIGCIEYLDRAFGWAEKYELQILIDLHTAPGSQNGFDNGGLSGVCKWAQMPEEVEFVLTVLERLAERYAKRQGLYGIEVLNEPVSQQLWEIMGVPVRYPAKDKQEAEGSEGVSSKFLRKFYVDAYHRLRNYLPEEKAVVLHDGFRLREWKDFMQEEEFKNVVLDTHMYLMMAEAFGCVQNAESYVEYIQENFRRDIEEMKPYFPIIVGEWCLFNSAACGEDTKAGVSPLDGRKTEDHVSGEEKKRIYQAVAKAQLEVFEEGSGYFYWSYKLLLDTVNKSEWHGWDSWDLGKCIDQGWFPDVV
jgi:aryl-phospho-beta-D-glucosidase BglC (GH1 family)